MYQFLIIAYLFTLDRSPYTVKICYFLQSIKKGLLLPPMSTFQSFYNVLIKVYTDSGTMTFQSLNFLDLLLVKAKKKKKRKENLVSTTVSKDIWVGRSENLFIFCRRFIC